MKRRKKAGTKAVSLLTAAGLLLTPFSMAMPVMSIPVHAQEAFRGELTSVSSVTVDPNQKNVINISFNDGAVSAKITFLEKNIFRYNVDPSGAFSKYAAARSTDHVARIPQYPDDHEAYERPDATVESTDTDFVISSGATKIRFNKATALMSVEYSGRVVMREQDGLTINNTTVQSLAKSEHEQFFGGGTQNGRFIHTGKSINIVNENKWENSNVSSPNPFYYTTEGYGVLRNTFMQGNYDFGSVTEDVVRTVHNESEFDAYYFLSDGSDGAEVVQDILQAYFKVTGNPVLLPEYGFYEGHLNCYNRDSWDTSSAEGGKLWTWKGATASTETSGEGILTMKEYGMGPSYRLSDGLKTESLNGELPTEHIDLFPKVTAPREYSAQAVIDGYVDNDMPIGYFVPNDGYGCGYGQNGYRKTGGVNADGSSSAERVAAIDANVENLKRFTEYAQSKGLETGLWTQSTLKTDSNPATEWHLIRDFEKEVRTGGITTLKTDVAWVGPGYSFGLNGVKFAYDIVTTIKNYRPNIISLDGWAGSQRFTGIWSGDQYGGNWEYIRFHIPTYIGQSLAGNPNVGSDMDGIFGGEQVIATRDTQWKAFTPQMLNMDGWGSFPKTPHSFGDPYTGISRMYLKLKARLMPYIYTTAASAANINTGNGDEGLPMVRAMLLEYPQDSQAYNIKTTQYQYMLGGNMLIAPVYTETAQKDKTGNDIRNGIYLPDSGEVWIDYFTGEQYRGGQVLNGFDTPIWKLPVFVKNGSILPMYEENNNPSEIDRTKRFVEFWPAGTTSYTVFEDDGKYVENKITEDAEYGKIAEISYGEHVSTTYESEVKGDGSVVLTANAAEGDYPDYDSNKETTFIVNVSQAPASVEAKNGDTVLTKKEVTSKADFEAQTPGENEFLYFYDETPVIETYAPDSEPLVAAQVEGVKVAPKLYVKFAETDSAQNAQVLTLTGFENNGNLPADEKSDSLTVPGNVTISEESKTPTSITLTWDEVAGADSYEVMADELIYSVGTDTSFVHDDLEYNSTHTYKVRARNAEGYSEWSEVLTETSLEDPWRNVPTMTISFDGGEQHGALRNATDHDFSSMFHSTSDRVVAEAMPVIIDLGNGYKLDKFEYYPRTNRGNGTVNRMDVYTSLDGRHWKQQQKGSEVRWTYDSSIEVTDDVKTVDLNGEGARYVKLVATESVGGFFSANELVVYKEDGSTSFAVGSTTYRTEVMEGDYSNMNNYRGTSVKDGANFVDQIQARYGDINYNNVYDVYDYAFTVFKLDGGTQKTGDVSGAIYLMPDVETAAAGEEFEIMVYADSVANLNAFGHVLNYDPSKVEFVSIEATEMTGSMEALNVNKVYEDGTGYYNLAYANKGDQPLVNGSGVLATITMKAKTAVSLTDTNVMDLTKVDLIGPNYSLITTDTSESGVPEILMEIPSSSITATALYSESNVADRAFDKELTTYWESPYGGNDANLPKDFVMELDQVYMVGKLDFTSHTAKNGGVTEFSISVSEDGQSWTPVANGTKEASAYLQNANVSISTRFNTTRAKYVKLTVTGAVGRIDEETNKYARIAEMALYGKEAGADAEDPAVNKTALQTLVNTHKNKVQGDYTDASWNSFTEALEAAEAVLGNTNATQTEVDQAKAALEAAVQGLERETTVDTVDKKALQDLVDANKATQKGDYTDASWNSFTAAMTAAEDMLANTNATQDEVDQAKAALEAAVQGLTKKAAENKPWIFTDMDSDVKNNTWKYKAVTYVYNTGDPYLMGPVGTSKEFQPDRPLERGMLATILYRWAGIKAVTAANPFTDVQAGKYYHDPIVWAADLKIVSGDTGRPTFRPTDHVKRSEIAKMLYEYGAKYLKLTMEKSGDLNQFTDAKEVPAWAPDYLKWATGNGIITGKPNGDGTSRLAPSENATRAECAAMIQRFADKYLK